MKIGSIDTKPAAPVVERKASTAAAPAGGEASAQVALSPAAQLLATPAPEAASFDSAKVERISQAIRDGKFVINAEAIADKLIVNAEELLAKRPN
jgi:negative regulator of flagellin synthesis FlgM